MDDRKHVLMVVEDEPDIRLVIRLHLTADPRLVVEGEAATAMEAVALARASGPGLVVLDHQIEGDIMGLDAAPLLKEAAPESKILLFTAFDLAKEAAASPHIDAFLSKNDIAKLLPTALALLGLEPAPRDR